MLRAISEEDFPLSFYLVLINYNITEEKQEHPQTNTKINYLNNTERVIIIYTFNNFKRSFLVSLLGRFISC